MRAFRGAHLFHFEMFLFGSTFLQDFRSVPCMTMGTAAKLAFLVIALAFFMGCAGAGSGAGGSANGVQYYSATCYQPSYVGTGTSAYPVSPSVSPTREGHPTYWCTN